MLAGETAAGLWAARALPSGHLATRPILSERGTSKANPAQQAELPLPAPRRPVCMRSGRSHQMPPGESAREGWDGTGRKLSRGRSLLSAE